MDFASPRAAREMYSRAAWTIAFALVLYFINRAEYPGPAATLAVVITLIGAVMAGIGYALHWLSTEGERAIQVQILDSLSLQGSERILSLSHPLGIEAAKRLKSGKVISLGETDANEAARESAKNQGLIDRIRFEAGDLSGKLSYPDANFDTILSSRALGDVEREKAIRELLRVLKPGGCLLIHETKDIASWERLLREAKLPEIVVTSTSLPLGLGGRFVSSRK
jgi:SAM-dependent methyltransferase